MCGSRGWHRVLGEQAVGELKAKTRLGSVADATVGAQYSFAKGRVAPVMDVAPKARWLKACMGVALVAALANGKELPISKPNRGPKLADGVQLQRGD